MIEICYQRITWLGSSSSFQIRVIYFLLSQKKCFNCSQNYTSIFFIITYLYFFGQEFNLNYTQLSWFLGHTLLYCTYIFFDNFLAFNLTKSKKVKATWLFYPLTTSITTSQTIGFLISEVSKVLSEFQFDHQSSLLGYYLLYYIIQNII